MRIVIKPSAREHLITDAEIRAVIGYPELVVTLVARIPDTEPALFVGRAADNEPHIEVIADLVDPDEVDVFHAMMLRRALVKSLGLDLFITPEYGRQRA